MAYLSQQQSIDEANKAKNLRLSTASTGSSLGGGESGGSASPSAPSNSSGGFTGISDYLKANAGGAESLGASVAGDINKEVGQATTAIQSGQSTFGQKAQEGTNTFNQAALDKTTSTGVADADFNRILSGTYGGPKSLSDVGARTSIDKEVSEAQARGALAGTQGGRVQLLREIAGRPQTTGVTRLNSALLGGNVNAIGAVRGAAAQAGALGAAVTSAEQQAAQRAAQAEATNKAVREQGVAGVGGYLGAEEQAADARLASTKSAEQAKAEAARAYLRSLSDVASGRKTNSGGTQNYAAGGLTAEQAQSLQAAAELNKSEGGSAIDFNAYYTPAQIDNLTRSNVLSPEQASRYTALAQMIGRPGYTSATANLQGNLNLSGVQTEAQRNYDVARQARIDRETRAAADAALLKAQQDAADAAAAREAARLAAINDASTGYQPGEGGGGDGNGPSGNSVGGIGDSSGGPGGDGSSNGDGSTGSSTGGNSGVGNSAEGEGNTGPGGESGAGGGDSAGGGDGSTGGTGSDGSASGGNSGVGNSAEGEGNAGPGGESGAGGGDSAAGGAAGGVGDAPGSVGSAGGEGPGDGGAAGSSGGGGGGGGGGGCVVATALVGSGTWKAESKAELITWCERALHNNPVGEALRRAYQVIGSKLFVPAVRRGGITGKFCQWQFENLTNLMQFKKCDVLSVPFSLAWMSIGLVLGSVITKEYARKTWKSLYKDSK